VAGASGSKHEAAATPIAAAHEIFWKNQPLTGRVEQHVAVFSRRKGEERRWNASASVANF
jgi:hypothetical protein